jgi:tetratricopeptide (TPR) repeat protein
MMFHATRHVARAGIVFPPLLIVAGILLLVELLLPLFIVVIDVLALIFYVVFRAVSILLSINEYRKKRPIPFYAIALCVAAGTAISFYLAQQHKILPGATIYDLEAYQPRADASRQPMTQDVQHTDRQANDQNEAFLLDVLPDAARKHMKSAEHLIQTGNNIAAISEYRRAIKIAPHNAKLWSNMAFAQADLYDYADAVECGQKALSLDSSLTNLHLNIGLWLALQNKESEATEVYCDVTQWASEVAISKEISVLHDTLERDRHSSSVKSIFCILGNAQAQLERKRYSEEQEQSASEEERSEAENSGWDDYNNYSSD